MNVVYPQYPAYSSSNAAWIGSIPTHWHVLRGKFTFREHTDLSETGAEVLLSVSEYFGVKPRGEAFEGEEHLTRAESLVGYKKCSVDDLAMNIMLAWKKGLGISKYNGIVSPAYSVFRFMSPAHPDYMHYLLRTDLYADYFKSRSTGIMDSRLRLYPDAFGDVAILLPSCDEQTQIAKFLDYETARIDALIEKQHQLIALLKEKRQAVISHAVTKGLNPNAPMRDSGVEWLGEVPAHWESGKMKFFADLRSGHTPSRSNSKYWENCHIPWFSLADVWQLRDGQRIYLGETTEKISDQGLANSAADLLPAGTVILSRTASVGFSGIMPIPMATTQDFVNWIPGKKLHSEYLLFIFRGMAAEFDRLKIGSTHKTIYMPDVRQFSCPVPPLDEQKAIISYVMEKLAVFSRATERAITLMELLQERRTALISAAVTGKIDVRGWKPLEVSAAPLDNY